MGPPLIEDTMPDLINRIKILENQVAVLLLVIKQCEPTSHVLARLNPWIEQDD